MAIREFSLAIDIINTIGSFVSKVSSIDHERCYIGSLAILIITRRDLLFPNGHHVRFYINVVERLGDTYNINPHQRLSEVKTFASAAIEILDALQNNSVVKRVSMFTKLNALPMDPHQSLASACCKNEHLSLDGRCYCD